MITAFAAGSMVHPGIRLYFCELLNQALLLDNAAFFVIAVSGYLSETNWYIVYH
jgi:hypothetical protein